MHKGFNIVISGVGGQGVLLASGLLAEVGLLSGLEAKKAEVHGMAQRGGSVISHVKIGHTVLSPLVERGRADILIAMEPLEMLRYIDFVHRGAHVFYSTGRILPPTALFGKVPYPDDPEAQALERCDHVIPVDALAMAEALGLPHAVNVILLGAASSLLPFPDETWFAAIAGKVKAKYVEVNKKAFLQGRKAAAEGLRERKHA